MSDLGTHGLSAVSALRWEVDGWGSLGDVCNT